MSKPKKLFTFLILAVLTCTGMVGFTSSRTYAAGDNGYVIDSAIYYNKSAMSVDQINTLINSYPSSCLRSSNYPSGLSWPTFREPTGYFTYGDVDVSPAQIIWRASQLYSINPQVILTTLEKEQSLVSGSAGCASWKYNSAMGYNCPDSGGLYSYASLGIASTCVQKESNVTFSRQVNHAAWQLSFDGKRAEGDLTWMDDGATYYYGRMTEGWRSRVQGGTSSYYDGYATIDNTAVYLRNGPTAALYNYTPHLVSSFSAIFTQWFGSPIFSVHGAIGVRYSQLGGSGGVLGKAIENEVQMTPTSWYQRFENGYIVGSAATGYWESMGPIRDRWAQIGYQTGKMGYPTGPVTTTTDSKTSWQAYQNGYIVWGDQTGAWESKGAIREYWAKLGYQTGKMGYPTGPETYDGTGWWQSYQNGAIVGSAATGYWESMGPIRDRWAQIGYQTGKMGYPTGPVTTTTDSKTSWQAYQNGYIVWGDQTGAWESKGAIREYWAKLGYQTGVAGFPTGPETYDAASTTWSQQYQHGTLRYSSLLSGQFTPN